MRETSTLERVQYWQGQRLASRDLEAQTRGVAELRRLHTRAVHSAYGIAIGLDVTDNANGTLSVACGLAYDCAGRELIVSATEIVPFPQPAIAAATLLSLGYNLATGEAMLGWRMQGTPDSRDSVALARILPTAGGPVLDADFKPIIARPLARPRLAIGRTVAGNTAWEEWDEAGTAVGVQTTIDTSASGFTTTPNYFAEAVSDNPPADFVPAWFTSIADPSASGFTLKLFMRGITREPFAIVDPKTQVSATPMPGTKLSLAAGNVISEYDLVTRLLPIVSGVSNITALSGSSATLDAPLDGLTDSAQVAFGNRPRIATVTAAPTPGAKITVDGPGPFQAGNVIAKLTPTFANANPTSIAGVDGDGGIELAAAITGLSGGDGIGVVSTNSAVIAVSASTVTVQDPGLFNVNDIVVCIDGTIEDLPTAQITAIGGPSNAELTLSPAALAESAGLLGLHIGVAKPAGTVKTIDLAAGGGIVSVDQPRLFKAGDLVTKLLPNGGTREPVLVASVKPSAKTITLSQSIPGLGLNDSIAAADYRIRATVSVVANGGALVTLANTGDFPVGCFVALLDDSLSASASATVVASAGGHLTLSPPISGLQAGNVLGLCSFPVQATVQGIDSSGIVQVDSAFGINIGDVVAALPVHPGVATIVDVSGAYLKLTAPITGLAAGDMLSVITMGGVVEATPGASNTKVTLAATKRIRTGDFLGKVVGWREPGQERSIAYVESSTGTDVTLFSPLNGVMVDDTIGLASVVGSAIWVQLRLSALPVLTPGDEALLAGLDRQTGETNSFYAYVMAIDVPNEHVYLAIEGFPGSFAIRPEDMEASVLFLSGSPLALVQNQNLYVSWLACQTPDAMPRVWSYETAPSTPCGTTVQI